MRTSTNMSDSKIAKALRAVLQNGVAGVFWACSMILCMIRANIHCIFALRRPSLFFVSRGVVLQGLAYAEIGSFSRFSRYARLSAWRNGVMRIGRNFSLGEASVLENGYGISGARGRIEIGDNVGIGAFSFISCPSVVSIGSDCIIGQYFSIHAQNHNFDGTDLIRFQGTTEKGVSVGNNCWIGAKVTVLDGVSIGAGSVIAAGAVVTRSFPERSLIGGCPAKLIRDL